MLIPSIIRLFHRDLDKLILEIQSYEQEADLWKIQGKVKNSAGTLCLHLIGNLNYYIGQGIGKTGYIRNRPLEFSARNILAADIIQMLKATKVMIEDSLQGFDETRLMDEKPLDFTATSVETMQDYLLHLYSHFNWHLGQVNYLRRMID